MYTCSKCGFTNNSELNFCPMCGAQVVSKQNTTEQPIESASGTTVKKPHLAFKIISMVLSIEGFYAAYVTLILTLVGLIQQPFSFEFSVGFSLFYAPLSVVGLIFSNKCRNAGDNLAFSKVGKILGLIGIILYGVSLFIGVMSLGAGF